MKNLIATSESMANGAIVTWEASGFTSREKLRYHLEDAGFAPELLPAEETPSGTALMLTLDEVTRRNRRMLRRRIRSGVWGIVSERVTEDEDNSLAGASLEHSVDFKVWLETNATGAEQLQFQGSVDQSVIDQITDLYKKHKENISPSYFGLWLGPIVRDHLCGFTLKRKSAGHLFVPEKGSGNMTRWETLCGAIKAANEDIELYTIPAMDDERTLEAVMKGIEAEVQKMTDEVEEQLDVGIKGRGGKRRPLGQKAMTTKRGGMSKLRERLAAYDVLLGDQLDTVRTRIDEVDLTLAAAMIAEAGLDDADSMLDGFDFDMPADIG